MSDRVRIEDTRSSRQVSTPCLWIDEHTDFAALARRFAAASQEVWPATDPTFDLDPLPLQRAYAALRDTPFAARLSQAAADCLLDPNAGVRAVALAFFRAFPQAAGAEQAFDHLLDPQRQPSLLAIAPEEWNRDSLTNASDWIREQATGILAGLIERGSPLAARARQLLDRLER